MWVVLYAALALSSLFAAEAAGEEIHGRVVAVIDGDTIKVLTAEKQQLRVRLAEIDTPEKGQPYANRAKQALSRLVFDKQVRVKVMDTDRYGRTVGRVFVGGTDVNAVLIEQGLAWVYRKYTKDAALFRLENEARKAKRGLLSMAAETCMNLANSA